jgi:hypothetical protein
MELESVSKQRVFELSLLEKTRKQSLDVLLLENGKITLYRRLGDMVVFLVFSGDENEIMMYQVLECFVECLQESLPVSSDKRSLLDNYDVVCLIADEMIDQGIVLEMDTSELLSRVPRRQQDGPETPISDQNVGGAYQTAKFIRDQILKG